MSQMEDLKVSVKEVQSKGVSKVDSSCCFIIGFSSSSSSPLFSMSAARIWEISTILLFLTLSSSKNPRLMIIHRKFLDISPTTSPFGLTTGNPLCVHPTNLLYTSSRVSTTLKDTTGVYMTSWASKNLALREILWLIMGTCLRFRANA